MRIACSCSEDSAQGQLRGQDDAPEGTPSRTAAPLRPAPSDATSHALSLAQHPKPPLRCAGNDPAQRASPAGPFLPNVRDLTALQLRRAVRAHKGVDPVDRYLDSERGRRWPYDRYSHSGNSASSRSTANRTISSDSSLELATPSASPRRHSTSALAVRPEQVVQTVDGCQSPDGLMSSSMVIGPQPSVKGRCALGA